MFRTLAIVAAAAFVLAAFCFAGATALGGRALAREGFAANGGAESWIMRRLDGWLENLETLEGEEGWQSAADLDFEQTSRELAWSGGTELSFLHGGDVHFRQGPERRVVVTGPARIVERYSMHDGGVGDHTGRNGSMRFSRASHAVSIEITAPDVDTFALVGGGNATIEGYDQHRLEIVIVGSGDVAIRGAAERVEISILGSGNVDAGAVAGADAHVEILGSGDAVVAPTQSADINIAGSGDVTLIGDPEHVHSEIGGSGDLIRRPQGATAPHPL